MQKYLQTFKWILSLAFLTVLTTTPNVTLGAGSWSTPVIISNPPSNHGTSPAVAVDGSGNALAVWENFTQTSVWASYLPVGTTTWSTPVQISPTQPLYPATANPVVLSMNSSGQAIAIWQSADGITHVNTFSGGAWGLSTPISTIAFSPLLVRDSPKVAISNAGEAIAVWEINDGTNERIQGATLSAFPGPWSAPFFFSPTGANAFQPNVAINNGVGMATWSNFNNLPNTLQASRVTFNPVVIGTPLNLVTNGDFPERSQVQVDSLGNAVVIFKNNNLITIQAVTISTANVVSSPVTISNSTPGNAFPQLGMDSSGNALAVWVESGVTSIIQSKILPFGGTWPATSQIVTTSTDALQELSLAENADGDAVLAWSQGGTPTQIVGSTFKGGVWSPPLFISNAAAGESTFTSKVAIGPTSVDNAVVVWNFSHAGTIDVQASTGTGFFALIPPSNLVGKVVKNKFLTQTDRIHRLDWIASPDPTVLGYHVYRNGVLIAFIPPQGPYIYKDHNRHPHIPDTYAVTAFNKNGESTPLTVTLE